MYISYPLSLTKVPHEPEPWGPDIKHEVMRESKQSFFPSFFLSPDCDGNLFCAWVCFIYSCYLLLWTPRSSAVGILACVQLICHFAQPNIKFTWWLFLKLLCPGYNLLCPHSTYWVSYIESHSPHSTFQTTVLDFINNNLTPIYTNWTEVNSQVLLFGSDKPSLTC